MNFSPKSRRAILPLTLGLLALGIAVFGWGLHYKISLYHPKHVTNHHQAANLLTDRERPLAQQVAAVHAPPMFAVELITLLPLLYFALELLGRCRMRVRYGHLRRSQSWRVCASASFSSFFFRPPPVPLFL